jgi:hypothetical protein
VDQGIGPEFKPQYCKTKQKIEGDQGQVPGHYSLKLLKINTGTIKGD